MATKSKTNTTSHKKPENQHACTVSLQARLQELLPCVNYVKVSKVTWARKLIRSLPEGISRCMTVIPFRSVSQAGGTYTQAHAHEHTNAEWKTPMFSTFKMQNTYCTVFLYWRRVIQWQSCSFFTYVIKILFSTGVCIILQKSSYLCRDRNNSNFTVFPFCLVVLRCWMCRNKHE